MLDQGRIQADGPTREILGHEAALAWPGTGLEVPLEGIQYADWKSGKGHGRLSVPEFSIIVFPARRSSGKVAGASTKRDLLNNSYG